jgi:hypothetical protein
MCFSLDVERDVEKIGHRFSQQIDRQADDSFSRERFGRGPPSRIDEADDGFDFTAAQPDVVQDAIVERAESLFGHAATVPDDALPPRRYDDAGDRSG